MTNFLSFVDEEINILEEANEQFMLFHPFYAREGKLNWKTIHELQQIETFIFADNNIVSPICEIVKNGTLVNKDRLRKVAAFVTLTKYLNAPMTCGLALIENDTAGKASISAEENRQLFLYGVDNIPPNIWKQLALGQIDAIPYAFLKGYHYEPSEKKYSFSDELHYLCHKAAITKIVTLLRSGANDGFQKFFDFFNWYIDHLILSESIIAYAALVFGGQKGVAKPKKFASPNFDKAIEGIDNQAWDMFYLSQWSTFYYYEEAHQVFMFASDDKTTKEILKHSLPPGKVQETISEIFHTVSQRKLIKQLYTDKLGDNRKRPFAQDETEKGIEIVKRLISKEMDNLQKTFLPVVRKRITHI